MNESLIKYCLNNKMVYECKCYYYFYYLHFFVYDENWSGKILFATFFPFIYVIIIYTILCEQCIIQCIDNNNNKQKRNVLLSARNMYKSYDISYIISWIISFDILVLNVCLSYTFCLILFEFIFWMVLFKF